MHVQLDAVVDLRVAVLALVALGAVAAVALRAVRRAEDVDAGALVEAGPLAARLHLHLLAVLALVLLDK